MADHYNFPSTVPALFAAHESRHQENMETITRLRSEVEALKQRKSCDTCARERGSVKCGSCCLYYSKKACSWIPAKAAIRSEWVK